MTHITAPAWMPEFVQYFSIEFAWINLELAVLWHSARAVILLPLLLVSVIFPYFCCCPLKLLWLDVFSTSWKFLLAVDSFSLDANTVIVTSLLLEEMPDLPWGNSQIQTLSLWKPCINFSAVPVLQTGLSQIKICICWISAKKLMCRIL